MPETDIVNIKVYEFTVIGTDGPLFVWAKDLDEAKKFFEEGRFIRKSELNPKDYELIRKDAVQVLANMNITYYT